VGTGGEVEIWIWLWSVVASVGEQESSPPRPTPFPPRLLIFCCQLRTCFILFQRPKWQHGPGWLVASRSMVAILFRFHYDVADRAAEQCLPCSVHCNQFMCHSIIGKSGRGWSVLTICHFTGRRMSENGIFRQHRSLPSHTCRIYKLAGGPPGTCIILLI
jgi:hypothetical protein